LEGAHAVNDDFEEFWSEIQAPVRKVCKKDAKRAYVKARKIAGKEPIHDGWRRYIAYVAHREPENTCHPATWLNGERWEDELPAPRAAWVKPSVAELRLHMALDETRKQLGKPH
jgi:hypothetical protein